ncbi:MAG: HypC/HybG/HupF family hydrogenase formation chaperone [Thaumarchaeota archaeon]|jgi:hydrogenase expression/formation protein HypC|nr:HypC/HybG/HupF family hydrogenase formation chaperone [Candidatus Terraquivivens yellowstonensis]MCL7387556.1 HypC/HybG/HupF family hydrogenase formation chaperone [Candidatus Terraquivivens yellowstonensis]MCL7392999.1 HypC/HybG/HupF family hydrogenase formation chaperone [Candidatus Terraquivivens yellowstonensis]MCL7395380.1 HypC/HybG/HupF family hydrogenase formation chaperone [Candidatus Terraquivivens yellowstonensis]MCL7397986.1 HypC/HybG/HupF family hydrogenase formation chaperone [C
MCLAIPAKVVEKVGNIAKVDFGDNTLRDVDVSLVDVSVGQYVLVHAGYAIQVLNEDEALKTIELLSEMLSKG